MSDLTVSAVLPAFEGRHRPGTLRGRIDALKYGAVTLLILICLCVQSAAAFRLDRLFTAGPHRTGVWWPFIDYPMYSGSRHPGETVTRPFLVGIHDDGTEALITPSDLGVNFWKMEPNIIWPLLRGDRTRLRRYTDAYTRRHGRRLAGLRLEDRPVLLQSSGPIPAPPRIVKTLSLPAVQPSK